MPPPRTARRAMRGSRRCASRMRQAVRKSYLQASAVKRTLEPVGASGSGSFASRVDPQAFRLEERKARLNESAQPRDGFAAHDRWRQTDRASGAATAARNQLEFHETNGPFSTGNPPKSVYAQSKADEPPKEAFARRSIGLGERQQFAS